MSIASAQPAPREVCRFVAHGFPGTQELPLLHQVEDASANLMAGQVHEVLLANGVPAELIETFKGVAPVDVARFFVMWINAGFDFEAASWAGFLSMHRTLFPQDEEPVAGSYDGETQFAEGLIAASQLDDYAEHIADQILEKYRTLH